MRKFLHQCEESLAHTGLSVLDTSMLYEMFPSQWASSQAALLDGVNPLKLVHALKAQQPGLTFIECDLNGKRVLVAMRSLVNIEDRLEALTGHRPSAIKEVQPTTTRFLENTRIPEVKKPVEPEFPPDFDAIAFERDIPAHDCHVRRQMLARLERWQKLNPVAA
ncbi:MAG: hypothetical protein RLZZ09_713 [Pseudomonadota bacterium]|jgi:hypothetical protein